MRRAIVADTVFTFPTDGEPSSWTLSRAQWDEWARLFPELDIDIELRDAYTWVIGSPSRRKTARGMPRYLLGWFRRSAKKLRDEQMSRRRAAQAPRKANWREECYPLHNPACRWAIDHQLRLMIAESCPHPGVCQTFAECSQKKEAANASERP